ncbi:hypothetical protein OSTOST_05487 [Ostertagia ostertagi]
MACICHWDRFQCSSVFCNDSTSYISKFLWTPCCLLRSVKRTVSNHLCPVGSSLDNLESPDQPALHESTNRPAVNIPIPNNCSLHVIYFYQQVHGYHVSDPVLQD